MPATQRPDQPISRWGNFKNGTSNAIRRISQSTGDWFRSFTRRKMLTYVLIQLFTLGILSAYPLSALVLLSVSAAMPLGIEIMFRLTGFVISQIASAISNRIIRPAVRRATGRDNAPLGIGGDDMDNSLNNDNRTNPSQIINALAMGDHARALRLVETVNVRRTHDLMTLCAEAIRRNAGDVFTRLLALPEVQQHVADNNNRLLIIAARERRANMVTALLANQQVRNNAAASNNEALREACSMGSLEIVEALLACPTVVTNINFNHREAVRVAENAGHFDIVARLLAIPAVANYQVPPNTRMTFTPRTSDRLHMPMNNYAFNPFAPDNLGFADLFDFRQPANRAPQELRNIANNRESAMDGLDANVVRELGSIQQRYQSTFQERGIDAILAEIRGFLIENYEQNPVRHNGRNLPLAFNRNLPANVQALYYTNKAHTAYRYLFLHPNPWISPNAAHTTYHANGGRSASISNDNKARIAYLWLAASDERTPLPQGSTRADVKRLFAELILSGAGRGHNYDNFALNAASGEEVDDGEGDKPTCGMGVSRWITQFVTLINDDPLSRPLSATIIKDKFKAILIAEGGHAEAVFTKLAALSKANLAKTKEALENLVVVNMGDKNELDDAERALLAHLEPSRAAIDAMVNECKTFFGEARITGRTERITYQTKTFQSYEECLRHMAANVLGDFYNELNAKIISLEKGTPKKGVGDKLVRFTPKKASARASDSSDKENSSDDANKANTSRRRRRA